MGGGVRVTGRTGVASGPLVTSGGAPGHREEEHAGQGGWGGGVGPGAPLCC